MRIDILTLFPEMFSNVLHSSILGRALDNRLLTVNVINFRDFSEDKHRTVDEPPYGGGGGMVLKPQPIFSAVEHLLGEGTASQAKQRIILMSPQGEPFCQSIAEELAQEEHLILICGHYEGFDERVRQHLATDELSIGDYVLTGGELPAMVIVDCVTRLIPGVLGNEQSAQTDSFAGSLLEHPHYTRPATFRNWTVPDVLLSGNHAKIEEWRRLESIRRTWERRPELLERAELTKSEREYLEQLNKQAYTKPPE